MKKILHLFRQLWYFIRSVFRKKRKTGGGEEIIDPVNTTTPEKLIEKNIKPNTMNNDTTETDSSKKQIDATPEFLYLYRLIYYRMRQSIKKMKEKDNGGDSSNDDSPMPPEPAYPKISEWQPYLRHFMQTHDFNFEEQVLILIALAPYIYPWLFDMAIERALKDGNTEKLIEIGGVTYRNIPCFLPTGETVIYLVNGPDIHKRYEVQKLFGAEHLFWEKKILWLEDMQESEPPMHGRLIMSSEYVHKLTTGSHKSPQFSISFPARKIAPLEKKGPHRKGDRKPPKLEDLVIPKTLRVQIDELISWLKYNRELMEKMNGKMRKGYRTLFYGPPGTGKTFTAEILGNELKKDVYKIDLSMVISKYIGETEKNLERLFSRAEDTGWILFFDEADALFGKRTNVRDAHDKYANQEVSYLLQRIEDYNGLVILASNMKNNIDDAFMRRFNSTLQFPFPDAEQRAMIWLKSFPPGIEFRKNLGDNFFLPAYDEECRVLNKPIPFDLPDAVKKYELTGGNIINVINYAGIKAVERLHMENNLKPSPACTGDPGMEKQEDTRQPCSEFFIYFKDVLDGIKRELTKEGKPFAP